MLTMMSNLSLLRVELAALVKLYIDAIGKVPFLMFDDNVVELNVIITIFELLEPIR